MLSPEVINTNTYQRGGSWNEQGLVQSLDRKGFIPSKCISELIANSCDAQSLKALFIIRPDCIKLVDSGLGMSLESVKDMFDMFKSNNSLRKSMGVSGLGGKEAIYILSKKPNRQSSPVIIYTHTKDGLYIKAIIPWDKIFKEKKYTNQIIFEEMSETEIISFNKDRSNEEFQHGTTIQWEYSDNLVYVLETQFNKIDREKNIDLKERWDMIFGLKNISILLEKSDGNPVTVLPKYVYFGDVEVEYYTGKNIEIIDHYVDDKNNDRFIWNDEEDQAKEIKQTTKTISKTPTNVIVHQTWKLIGSYEVYNGMKKHKRIFDETLPQVLDTAECFLSKYESEFFNLSSQKDIIKEHLSKVRLYRNEQCITQFKLEGYNASSARASAGEILKSFHHRTEVHYATFSTQDNRMDISMGIQENKNQNQNEFPKTFERLICFLKKRNFDKIDNHFDEVIKLADEKKRLEQEKIRLEKEQLEKIRLEKEQLEKNRLENEQLEKIRLENEQLEKIRLENEQLEKIRLDNESLFGEESKKEEESEEESEESGEESKKEEESEEESGEESEGSQENDDKNDYIKQSLINLIVSITDVELIKKIYGIIEELTKV